MSQIRCHNGYCSFNSSPKDCPLCHGTGWHYCGGPEQDAKLIAGTPYDSASWAEWRKPAPAPQGRKEE
jgi:hypothetical protein